MFAPRGVDASSARKTSTLLRSAAALELSRAAREAPIHHKKMAPPRSRGGDEEHDALMLYPILYGTYSMAARRTAYRRDYCLSCDGPQLATQWRSFVVGHFGFIPLLPLGFRRDWRCNRCGRDPAFRANPGGQILLIGGPISQSRRVVGDGRNGRRGLPGRAALSDRLGPHWPDVVVNRGDPRLVRPT